MKVKHRQTGKSYVVTYHTVDQWWKAVPFDGSAPIIVESLEEIESLFEVVPDDKPTA